MIALTATAALLRTIPGIGERAAQVLISEPSRWWRGTMGAGEDRVEGGGGLARRPGALDYVAAYAETTGCRRQFLLGYFGEQLRDPCDTCDAGTAEDRGPAAGGFELNSGVRHPEWGPGVVMSSEQDRITVLFDQVGYKTLALAAVERDNLLTPDAAE